MRRNQKYSVYCFFGYIFAALLISGTGNAMARQANPEETPPYTGVIATVLMGDNPEINVRSGPGIDYALVGRLPEGAQVPAIGRSIGGDWVQIRFTEAEGGVAWVYAYLVTLSGEVPLVEPPPTPTPRTTPTIDPTLAAQFIIEKVPTRLPTFTPPPPLEIPTYTLQEPVDTRSPEAVLYAVIGLGILGILGLLMSFIRVR
jgi:hypothetical protein